MPKRPDGTRAPKATDAEIMKRVNKVYALLLTGVSRADIIEYTEKNKWGVQDSTIDTYIRKANDRFAEQSRTVHDEQLGLAISRLNNLHEKCVKTQDYKAALMVQKELNTLLGLHKPTKHEVGNLDGGVLAIRIINHESD